ncbi:hypothetical protein ACA545_00140, partial [Vibrio cholerae]
TKKGILLHDYGAVELNTQFGEKLAVLFELNSWYRVSRSTGEVGWVPVKTAVELNTQFGEKLAVLFELNSWYRVSRSTGEVGWVPVKTVKRT